MLRKAAIAGRLSSLLNREPNTQSAIDAADNLPLPLENSWIAAEEVAQATCCDGVDDCADEADQREYNPKNGKLCDHKTSFWGDELRQKRKEEQRGLRVQNFGKDRLSESLRCRDGNATLAKIDGSFLEYRLQTKINQICSPKLFHDGKQRGRRRNDGGDTDHCHYGMEDVARCDTSTRRNTDFRS